jgi:hypothetical protein
MRLYAGAQRGFLIWLQAQPLGSLPDTHDAVARYLRTVLRRRGASVVPVHASAIAALYRDQGLPLDTRAPAIQAVLSVARREMGV